MTESTIRAYKFLNAEYGLLALKEKRLKLSLIEDLNDPFELLPYDCSDPQVLLALNWFKHDHGQRYAMLCLSKSWRSPVIWAHYADKHYGLALGFDVPISVVRHVMYDEKRVQWPGAPTAKDVDALFEYKYEHWRYEDEVRISAQRQECDNHGRYFIDFDLNLVLKEVVMGCRFDVERRREIRAAVDSEVRLIRAKPSLCKYEMERSLFVDA